jgi:flagella basal body P-ring formation protein FlgA
MSSANGVASQSGVVGDKIVVQNSSSREKLLAEVIEPGRVRVAF